MSTFSDHLAARVVRALERVPVEARARIYVVNLLVATAADPRHLTVTVSANDERRRQARVECASDEFTALSVAWDAAAFAHPELDEIGDPEHDEDGAMAWRRHVVADHGGWPEESGGGHPDPDDDRVLDLRDAFLAEVVAAAQSARALAPSVLGRTPAVTIDTEMFTDPVLEMNARANAGRLPDGARRWYALGAEDG